MKYLIIILIPLIFFSCRKEETPIFRADPLDGEKAILVGTWQWIYTDYWYDYCNPPAYSQILTPATENKTYQITFDKEGYVNFDGKDVKRIVFAYWRIPTYPTPKKDFEFAVNLNNNDDLDFLGGVTSDTLIVIGTYINEPFSSVGCDGCCRYTNYFVKI